MLEARCPSCGEPVEIDFDPIDAGDAEHRFVQDCDVCCRPMTVVIRVDVTGSLKIAVERAS